MSKISDKLISFWYIIAIYFEVHCLSENSVYQPLSQQISSKSTYHLKCIYSHFSRN